jgi:hypothetical protein
MKSDIASEWLLVDEEGIQTSDVLAMSGEHSKTAAFGAIRPMEPRQLTLTIGALRHRRLTTRASDLRGQSRVQPAALTSFHIGCATRTFTRSPGVIHLRRRSVPTTMVGEQVQRPGRPSESNVRCGSRALQQRKLRRACTERSTSSGIQTGAVVLFINTTLAWGIGNTGPIDLYERRSRTEKARLIISSQYFLRLTGSYMTLNLHRPFAEAGSVGSGAT